MALPPQRSASASWDAQHYANVGHAQFPPVLLMAHPSMMKMAIKLVDQTTLLMSKSNLKVKQNIRLVELCDNVQWKKFKDGWPDIFIDNVHDIAGRDVILLASLHDPAVVFEQLSLIYALPRYLVRSFRLILPFFPTGTMERIDTEGQIVTAKCMASLLSGIPFAARGPAQIFIFDIHALQERFYFTDQVIPRLLSAIPLLKRELITLPDESIVSIAFPDEGAWKRFHTAFPKRWPTVTCTKIRRGEDREVTIKEGDPSGRHMVIVDDLVQTGGTLINCAKVLKKGGAAKISIYVTHGVFPRQSWKSFTVASGQIVVENFWLTDSIPHAVEIAEHPPFKLLSLCHIIADSLLGYDLLPHNQ